MLAVRRQALDGLDRVAVGLRGEHQAGANGNAVEDHRAGAADAVLAADMGPRQQEIVPQEVAQQQSRLHAAAVWRAVHRDADIVGVSGHAAPVRWPR